jgi:hypothetical protein
MSKKIAPYGTVILDAAASDIIAAYSLDDAKVYTKSANSPYWGLLSVVTAGEEYASSALSAAKQVKIEAGGSDVYYSIGAAAVVTDRRGLRGQGAPGVLNATGTLTAAMIASGIVTSTTAAAVTATLNTGALMDAALELEIGESFDWSAIATGANAFTVTAAASGHTVVGAGAVATGTSGLFRTRKTAASTFVTYRIG